MKGVLWFCRWHASPGDQGPREIQLPLSDGQDRDASESFQPVLDRARVARARLAMNEF